MPVMESPTTFDSTLFLITIVPVSLFLLLCVILIAFAIKYNNVLRNWFSKSASYCCPCLFPTHVVPSKPGGLRNNSTTCYMNSMIQAIASSDKIIEQFVNMKQPHYESKPLNLFLKLLDGINEEEINQQNVTRNTDLLESLITEVNWSKSSQQDTFDLFSALVKCIHDDLKTHVSKTIQMAMKIKLVHRFTGMDMSDKVQDHLGLSVGLCGNYRSKPGVSLAYLLQEHFSATLIDDDQSKKTQMFFYREVPDILLLHIQANKWDLVKDAMIKPEYYIMYDENLSIDLEIVPELNSPIRRLNVYYKIKAVIQHDGDISGGHYVTYRNWRNRWYKANDERVNEVPFDKSVVPYVIIYEKQ